MDFLSQNITRLVQIHQTIASIRKTELDLFEEHLQLESHPGDGLDMLGALDPEATENRAGENHFKPLEKWFEEKEKSIQNLTEHLEKVCDQIARLNEISSHQ